MHRSKNTNNVAVAISGGGRSLANLLESIESGQSSFNVCAVVSSRPDCGGVAIAEKARLPIFVGDFSKGKSVETGRALYEWLDEHEAYWLALAGFLKPLPIDSDWRQRVINIHPALLPKFGGRGMYGDKVHQAVLANGESQSGASIHFVNESYDEGQIIAQARVATKKDDTPHSLAKRVFEAECKLYPKVLNELVAMTLPLADKKIKIYEF